MKHNAPLFSGSYHYDDDDDDDDVDLDVNVHVDEMRSVIWKNITLMT
jgi:hypothetical protein